LILKIFLDFSFFSIIFVPSFSSEHLNEQRLIRQTMFYDTTFYLIGETLIHLTGKPVSPLAGCSLGWMGVFSLGEMKNENN